MTSKDSAQALRGKNRKTITLPNAGVDIVITKLNAGDFVEARGALDIPADALIKKSEPEQRGIVTNALRDPVKLQQYVEFILSRGVMSPRVIVDRTAALADDEIYMSDLGKDRTYVIDQIVEFSGCGEKAEAVSTFRKKKTAKPVDA